VVRATWVVSFSLIGVEMVGRPSVDTRKNAGEVEEVLPLNQTRVTVQMKPVQRNVKNTLGRRQKLKKLERERGQPGAT